MKTKLLNPILLAGIMGLPAMALACDECGDDSCVAVGASQTTDGGNGYTITAASGDVTDDGDGNITTGDDSSCVIRFDNGGSLAMGEGNQINVDDFLCDPYAAVTAAGNSTTEPDDTLTTLKVKLSKTSPKYSGPVTGAAGIRG